MFELSQFYEYCKQNHVDVIPFAGMPAAGATVRDQGHYAVFLDFSKIRSTRLLRGVCGHELSHVATGALHKVSSPFELAQRSEYRANRYFAQHFLPAGAFREAFEAGYTELWQLAEYFDLPEQDVKNALSYWTERKGVRFEEWRKPPSSEGGGFCEAKDGGRERGFLSPSQKSKIFASPLVRGGLWLGKAGERCAED